MAKMRDVAILALILCVPMLAALAYLAPDAPAYAANATPDGRAIFLAQKCDLCHAVPAVGIAATTKSEKMKGPEINNLAAQRNADWLRKYLTKNEAIDGKKHGKEFKGSDAELTALTDWLLAQKK